MKSSKVDKLKKRLTLMDSLVKAGALYGVELWGWKRREEIERVQGRFVKMAMGLVRNTPDYRWKLEAGKRSIEIQARRRAGKYLVEVLKIKEGRWPKVCLREESRGIVNGNPSRWGVEFRDAMRGVADGRTVDLMWSGAGGVRLIEKYLGEGDEKKKEQDIQADCVNVDKSTFCSIYKAIKGGFEREKYWDERMVAGELKEQWARLRCGNFGKAGKKGFNNQECELCGVEEKNLKLRGNA